MASEGVTHTSAHTEALVIENGLAREREESMIGESTEMGADEENTIPSGHGIRVRGIHVTKFLPERRLHLNGAGVRSFSLLGSSWLSADIYLASFYTQSGTLQSHDQVYQAVDRAESMQFNFTFLRAVADQGQVTKAWQRQLDHSVEHNSYDHYHNDSETFCQLFGPILDRGATETVFLHQHETIVYDQGVFKGKIVGKHFQRAFVSMWFGTKAVASDLKDGLLGLRQEEYEHIRG